MRELWHGNIPQRSEKECVLQSAQKLTDVMLSLWKLHLLQILYNNIYQMITWQCLSSFSLTVKLEANRSNHDEARCLGTTHSATHFVSITVKAVHVALCWYKIFGIGVADPKLAVVSTKFQHKNYCYITESHRLLLRNKLAVNFLVLTQSHIYGNTVGFISHSSIIT